MVREIDAGPIAYHATFPIEESDTPLSLTHKCIRAGVPLILRLVETVFSNPEALPALQQDLAQREYFGKQIPQGGRLSWARPAEQVVNFVRSCDYAPYPSPWGSPKTKLGGREIEVLKASRTGKPCESSSGVVGVCGESGAEIACADEWISVRTLKIEGRNCRPLDVLQAGDRFEEWPELSEQKTRASGS
jgi:UDP-4-amino-4-deoxy-L-arabinose formyltransferase/UDP-glucuronic acid dehydrogenase (UDP-4-keto-hexauronic acid decarboxylating)